MKTTTVKRVWIAALLAGVACQTEHREPPPPPAKYEVAPAPPQARGARAAGTDAAPALPSDPGADPEDPVAPPDDPPADAGAPLEPSLPGATGPDAGGVAL